MTTVEIKKGKGIEGLFEGFAVGKPEEEKPIEVVEGVFQELMGEYERFLETECDSWNDFQVELNKITETVTPADITAFLQTTIKHEQHNEYCWRTGLFISKLMQNSYEAGHNDFILNTTALKEIHNLGCDLTGTEERLIKLTIIGNTGDWCGWGSRNLSYKTPNKKTLDKMLKNVKKGNRIIFVHPDGSEEIMRRYNELNSTD